MKADLTRDTFHPLKHFARVLTQQGRVQLDADMNEQAAILRHYLQTLAADLIGPAGGPCLNCGFQIIPLTPSPTPLDFQIAFGNYYVNGLLCQADFTPIAIFPTVTNPAVFQVMNWSPDFEATPVPYYEVFDATPGSTLAAVPVQITSPQASQNQITIQPISSGASFASYPIPMLRRQITYLHQPDLPFSAASGAVNAPAIPATGSFQFYLDVWERVITYAQDDSIREVALGGPDTAARTKLVWQVKFTQPAAADTNNGGGPICMTAQALSAQLLAQLQGQTSAPFQPQPRGWLQAMAKQTSVSTNPCIINPNAAYTGPENQLYRVEINRSGTAGTTSGVSATFKWSRENGSVFYPITSGGATTTVVVESLGRDDRFGLVEGNLVETQDDRSVLLNQLGILLPVQSINPTTLTVTLNGAPAAVVGSDESLHPLLRRWDQTSGDPNAGGLTLDPADNCAYVQEGQWLMLENGVQIFFQPADPVLPSPPNSPVNHYLTGDYWLIPARTATGDVEWPTTTNAAGDVFPVALPPQGITHYCAPLAVVSLGATPPVQDCRNQVGLSPCSGGGSAPAPSPTKNT
ncbi:MAG: DUF6519 domain-containing protein [Terracidiphilus sp.]